MGAKKTVVNSANEITKNSKLIDSESINIDNGNFKNKVAEFKSRVEQLKERGYHYLGPMVSEIPSESPEGNRRKAYSEASNKIGGCMGATFGMFDDKQPVIYPVKGIGTPGYGYIPWGPNNDLPNIIFNMMSSLPYTAAGLKYITDLTVGLGPKLMYKWPRYAGGTIKEELIPYEHAGVLLSNRIREIRNQIKAEQDEESANKKGGGGEEGSTIQWMNALNPRQETSEEEKLEDMPGTLQFELKRLLEDYKVWENDWGEISRFIEYNNLNLHYQKCIVDDTRMDIYFPTVGLSLGRVDEEWHPKITKVGHLPVVCARLEQKDKKLHINYVYYSERWRQDTTAELKEKEIVAYPAAAYETMLSDWESLVQKHKKTAVKKRPLWIACPIFYPSMQKPYYPQPDYWSLITSLVYNYASTLMVDKAISRQNATMWGKIIFINQDYLTAIYDLSGADTPEEQDKIRNGIFAKVNQLLQKRENNGKSILMDMFSSPDGKTMQYSIEIVDVPAPQSGADTKDELEEISSIIFFTIGVSPNLIGSIPGKSSSGGTDKRESQLLKQSQVSSRQRAYLNFLQNIFSFNKWDKHAVWVIRQQVLSTLDRSGTGLEETNSN